MKKLIEKSKILQFFRKINEKLDENLLKMERRKGTAQRCVNLVDLENCCKMSIWT